MISYFIHLGRLIPSNVAQISYKYISERGVKISGMMLPYRYNDYHYHIVSSYRVYQIRPCHKLTLFCLGVGLLFSCLLMFLISV